MIFFNTMYMYYILILIDWDYFSFLCPIEIKVVDVSL